MRDTWILTSGAITGFFLFLFPTFGQEISGESWDVEIGLVQSYDTNVHQIGQGRLADRSTWISEAHPEVALRLRPGQALSYQAFARRFWNAGSEDHVRQQVGYRGEGELTEALDYRANLSLTRVDGSSSPLIFDQGRSAFSTVTARERRNQWQSRILAELTTRLVEDWFVRGRGNLIGFKLDTDLDPSRPAGFDNYIDRYELRGDLDIGRKSEHWGTWYLGFRHGYQGQGRQGGRETDRSNHFNRAVGGWAVDLGERLNLSGEMGPSWHRYNYGPGDLRRLFLYADVNASVRMTRADTLRLGFQQRPWVASTGLLSNKVIRASASWVRQLPSDWSASAGAVVRSLQYDGIQVEDWVYSGEATLRWTAGARTELEFRVEHSLGRDEVLGRPGREFDQTVLSLAVSHWL